nr:MAG TPA: hypothetical protein [Caudoviricetes sp.]DAQ28564.1 MAG TPA: hypothetical protein [Caudoviricetes sp.]
MPYPLLISNQQVPSKRFWLVCIRTTKQSV